MYLEIKRQLELAIIRGTYKSAEKFPSINEITEIYSCGNSTAQKVLTAMHKEGTITKQKGIGYFVKPFVQKALLEKYTVNLRLQLIHIVDEAKMLNLNRDNLVKIIDEQFGSIYSP